jgi:Stress responsive A/B Barrel Domain
MIRHTVLFKWTPEATDDQKQRAADELAKLPSIVGSVRSFVIGQDAGLAEGNFDFALTADFDDEAGYAAYRDAPAHLEVITRHIRPIIAERAAVQFEY